MKYKPKTEFSPGQVYNRLTIINFSHSDIRHRKFFNTICECGSKRIVMGAAMVSGNTKSCGCWGKESRKLLRIPGHHSEITAIILQYKRHAKERGLAFNLSRDEVIQIIYKNCKYCGIPPSNLLKTKNSIEGLKFSGIDRVDSQKDYLYSNVVPCCKTCNYAKSNMPETVFIEWIQRAYNHLFKPL